MARARIRALFRAGNLSGLRVGGGGIGLFCALVMGVSVPAQAQPVPGDGSHGLALHGQPLHPPGFAALNYANPEAPKGGTLRLALTGSFDSLNAYIPQGSKAAGLHYLNDTLMARTWDEPFTVYGLIAERAALAEDRSAITFHLRPEARFHDGEPIRAEDVVFSWQSLRDHGRPNSRRTYSMVDRVEVHDPLSLTFHLKPDIQNRELPLILAMLPVLPRHYWEGRDITRPTLEPPLGSGPYRIATVDRGQRITWERVPDYWAAEVPVRRGHHNFDQLIYDYYRDSEVALRAFIAGNADYTSESDPARWITSYSDVRGRADVRLEEVAHQRPGLAQYIIFNSRRAPFTDVRVREALSMLLDFTYVRDSLYRGMVERVDSLYPNSDLAAREAPSAAERALLEPFAADLDPRVLSQPFSPVDAGGDARAQRQVLRQAVALLGQAGYRVVDGQMRGAGGEPLRFEVLMRNDQDARILQAYRRVAERLGIEVVLRTMDSASFVTRLRQFDFDAVMFRWVSTLSPGNEQAFYFGSAAADQQGSRNYAGVQSAAVDSLVDRLSNAESREELVAATRALDRVLTHSFLGVPLFYSGTDFIAYRAPLTRPQQVSLYGPVIEVFWSAAEGGHD